MYYVWLQGTEDLYGSFITQTEADLFLSRRGWVAKTNISVLAWEITVDGKHFVATLSRQASPEQFHDKELLPKGVPSLEVVDDLLGRFYQKHFQTL